MPLKTVIELVVILTEIYSSFGAVLWRAKGSLYLKDYKRKKILDTSNTKINALWS